MQEEMFEELWKNGQLALSRRKAEGYEVPSHGRTKHVVKEAMVGMVVPEHIHWGGVMRFPADRIIRGEEVMAIVATTTLLVQTDEGDVREQDALRSGLRRFVKAYTEPMTLFLYMPPLPMPTGSNGWRGWSVRYVARAGHGWKLAPEGV